jgi:hypothetical protein
LACIGNENKEACFLKFLGIADQLWIDSKSLEKARMDSMFGPSESSALPMAFKAKVILLGDHAVGKSAVVNRYIKNYFEESKHVQW